MTGITSNVGKTTQQLAQDVAKRVVREPFEVLKYIPKQVTPVEIPGVRQSPSSVPGEKGTEIPGESEENLKEKDKIKSQRQLEALNREIEDIRRQALFNELINKIKSGQEVSLDSLASLPFEQREVLKSQMEAMKMVQAKKNEEKPLVEPASKPSRKFWGFGQKGQAEKQQTRVERPLPPSG